MNRASTSTSKSGAKRKAPRPGGRGGSERITGCECSTRPVYLIGNRVSTPLMREQAIRQRGVRAGPDDGTGGADGPQSAGTDGSAPRRARPRPRALTSDNISYVRPAGAGKR